MRSHRSERHSCWHSCCSTPACKEQCMANGKMTILVGVFKDYKTAQTVAQELERSGFSANNVHVTGEARDSSGQGERASEAGGGVAGFFRRLFGSEVDEEET